MIESFKLPNITPEAITGSIVSFNDEYGGLPLKSCTSLITGYQEGSGTPSPSNVRPLHAWSSASLGKCDNNTAQLWSIDNSFNGDVEFNQLVKNGNFADTSNWSSINGSLITASNNTLDITPVSNGIQVVSITIPINSNHRYLFMGQLKADSTSVLFGMQNNGVHARIQSKGNGMWQQCAGLLNNNNMNNDRNTVVVVLDNRTSDWTTTQLRNVIIVDLTQMFGSTIADYIYNLETQTAGAGVAFFKALYPNDYYPYNAGTKQLVGYTLATFTFGQSIYLGSIDWKRGVAVGYKTLKTLNGSEDWNISGSAAYINNTDAKITNNYGDAIANSYSEIKNWTDVTSPTQSNYVYCIFEYSTWNNARIAFSLVGRTKAEFISDLQNNNIILAYELAVPIEIPLGGINLLTQQGVNNIFADCGDTEVKFLKVT